MKFFLKMIPPTITHQEKKVTIKNGKPVFYEPPKLKDAREKLTAYLFREKPDAPFTGPVSLSVAWLFPAGRHKDGEWKITKPDTDNLQKLLKDCMTTCGFWKDDAQVCIEITEKIWMNYPGILIEVNELTDSNVLEGDEEELKDE